MCIKIQGLYGWINMGAWEMLKKREGADIPNTVF